MVMFYKLGEKKVISLWFPSEIKSPNCYKMNKPATCKTPRCFKVNNYRLKKDHSSLLCPLSIPLCNDTSAAPSNQGKSVSLPLESGLACDLLWPTGRGRKNVLVLSLTSLQQEGQRTFLNRTLRIVCISEKICVKLQLNKRV